MQTNPEAPRKDPWLEVGAALLLALSALTTAWCSYQGGRWGGRGNALLNQSNSQERQGLALTLQSNQLLLLDTSMFFQWLGARDAGKDDAARFYADRFRPEMKQAFEAWLAEKPFEGASVDPHPFTPALYHSQLVLDAQAAHERSSRLLDQATEATGISARYVQTTVLVAAAMFFAGIATKFGGLLVRRGVFVMGLALFVYVLVRVIGLPAA